MASSAPAVSQSPSHVVRAIVASALLASAVGAQEPLFPVQLSDAGTYLSGVALADLDGDASLDAVTWSNAKVVNVVLGTGTGTFNPPITLPATGHVLTVAVGDLDADGAPDLVCQNNGSHTVSAFMGLGGGSFAPASSYPAGGQPEDVLLADIDEDGVLDTLVADFDGSVVFLAGNGTGGLLPPALTPIPAAPVGVDAGDLDLDGHLDAAVATVFSNLIVVLLGDGHGGLVVSTSYPTGPVTRDLELGDLDGNGLLDVATIRYDGGLSVLLATSPGVHAPAPDLALAPCFGIPYQSAEALDLSDIDADGDLDVLAASGECGELQVFAGDGHGDFATPVVHPACGGAGLDAGDVDGDGALDVAVVDTYLSLGVLRGDGAGGLISSQRLDVPGVTSGIVSADLDSDGAPDVVSSLVYEAGLAVLTGTAEGGFGPPAVLHLSEDGWTASLALADLDGDGDLDSSLADALGGQAFVVLGDGQGAFAAHGATAVGPQPVGMSTADFDENGKVDAALALTGGDAVKVLFGDGAGGWSASAAEAVGDDPYDVAAADLDADGHADLATANFASDSVTLLFGDGLGGFAATAPVLVAPEPWSVEPVDVDDDGDLDLLVAGAASASTLGGVSLLRGDGSGSFAAYELLGAVSARVAQGADVDGDGITDVLAADGGALAVLAGTGTGWFAAAVRFSGGGVDFAVLDVDRDGALDVVSATMAVSLAVLLNHTPTPWQVLPGGLAGGPGVPVLTGTGELVAGTPMSLALSGALPASPAYLVAGVAAANTPFKGGVLVPSADLVLPWLLTGPAGGLTLKALWPSGVPSGWTLYLQEWVHDAGAPKGFAATNGLAALVP